jgi:branched-chain amino acid aminotransferase
MYKSGVQLVTYPYVRHNPGIKKWDDRFRVSVSQFIRNHGVYEAILLNNRKQITEGSRSNIFFINAQDQLVSAPENEILPGITRKYVLEICRNEHIEVVHRPIHLEELIHFKSCFISGTSPKVLPTWQLDGIAFEVNHPLLQMIMERFEDLIRQNLENLLL